MLAAPDRKTLRGQMKHVLLLFLYNTGTRVSDAAQSITRGYGRHALIDIQRSNSDTSQALMTTSHRIVTNP